MTSRPRPRSSSRSDPPSDPRRAGAVRSVVAVVLSAAVALGIAACGEPEYQYPHDATEGVYFKVPSSWTVFDETDSFYEGRVEGGSTAQPVRVWVLDSNEPAAPDNIDDANGDLPVGIAQIIAVSPSLSENISISSVRSLGFEFDPVAPATGLEDTWEVVLDQPMRTEDGISGAVAVFSYRDTADDPWLSQARGVFFDPTRQRVYLLDLFCGAACFEQYRDDIYAIIDSWRIDL